MTSPIASVSGLVSGIQYRDLVDRIIAAEQAPAIRAREAVTTANQRQSALTTYRTLLDQLKAAAKGLRDGTAFDSMSTTTSIAAGSKQLFSATATSTATPSFYKVAVTSLAAAQKLAAGPVASPTSALGVAGTISLNGTQITVAATDTLTDLRDRINAVNTGATPTGITATILSVGPNAHRLMLQSDTAGAAGMALEDATGSVLQSLGVLSAPTTIDPNAVLTQGSDAAFTIDGVPLVRTTNVVSDAIPGVTLTLTGAEAGAATNLVVARFTDGAKQSAQRFVDAYNAVVDFIKQQGTTNPASGTTAGTRPPLYGEAILRTVRATLPSSILAQVGNAAADLSTVGMAGFSLDKSGKLSLDATKFEAAFTNRLNDLRQLFQQRGTSSAPGLNYISATTSSAAGTYDVDVTALPTKASILGSGLGGGTFVDDGTPDLMTVTDTRSGKSVTVALSDGMTAGDIQTALTAAFTANGLALTASVVGNELQLDHPEYGSTAGITVSYAAGGAASATLPIAAGTYAGTDIAGTIGGSPATGSGQVLVANTGAPPAGLVVEYTGASTGLAGSVTLSLGTGAILERQLTSWLETNSGTLDARSQALTTEIRVLEERAERIESRLERRRERLTQQFIHMEAALARLQSQSSGVLATFNALTNQQ